MVGIEKANNEHVVRGCSRLRSFERGFGCKIFLAHELEE